MKAKRQVPIHPDLVALLRAHRAEFNHGREGRIFTGPRGGIIRDSTYLPVWHKARERALSPTEQASGIAARPYDFRHACVSTWLNAGVNPPQVAEWAGHSVDVLLRVYAKCIAGGQVEAMRRIETALPRPPPLSSRTSPRQTNDLRRVFGAATRTESVSAVGGRAQRKRPVTAFPLVTGLFPLVWQVQGSNLRRLSRRFYSS
ncbi:hypothetical protein ACFQ0B_07385 [Nonomuraea thailandensis]